jgi:hypothetical protein
MANVAISGLPVTASMTDSSILPVVVSGVTSQISGANLKTYTSALNAAANTQVQFNDAGTLAGNSALTFDKATGLLSTTELLISASAGVEGGQINLALPVTTTLSGNAIIIDSYADQVRIIENGGLERGMYVDVANVGTDQLPIGYRDIPQVAQSSAYAVALTDMGKHVYATATMTATIPANSSVAFPVGATVAFIAGPTSTMTIAITSDTMYLAGVGTTGSRTLAPFGMATAVKVTSTTWFISGNGLT